MNFFMLLGMLFSEVGSSQEAVYFMVPGSHTVYKPDQVTYRRTIEGGVIIELKEAHL